MTPAEIGRSVRASSVAELFWTDPDGAPDGGGVVALTRQDAPVVAFTYAAEAEARAAAAAPLVALTVTEPRSTGTAFTPLAVTGRPRLVEDLDGQVFTDELLEQELRCYPPARKFADSVMLRREHWWYLPRLILVVDVQHSHPLPARTGRSEHVLVVADGAGLEARVVEPAGLQDPADRSLSVFAPDQQPVPSGPAALVGQDASFPDLEQWSSWCFRGVCDGTGLRLTQPPPPAGLPPPASLWQRWRGQRSFAGACRAGIRRAEGRSR